MRWKTTSSRTKFCEAVAGKILANWQPSMTDTDIVFDVDDFMQYFFEEFAIHTQTCSRRTWKILRQYVLIELQKQAKTEWSALRDCLK